MAYIAMTTLLNKLTGKLLEEKNLFDEVDQDPAWSLVCMLKRLRPFVMEFQRKQSPEVVKLIKEFVELVGEADDAIDSHVTMGGSEDEAVKFGSQIERIKWKLKTWQNRCFISTASSSVFEDKDDDDMVVGLENEVTMMIERLKDKDARRDVIPIVGPEGVGKTILARRVYNHPTIVENFPCRAWISANNIDYDDDKLSIKELFQEIIKQVSQFSPPVDHPPATEAAAAEKMILKDLAIQTYKLLKESERYLLVFDDVFTTQFWADINVIFPDYKSGGGGRIIFTTRYEEVALHARPSLPPFYLRPPLNKEESWRLFSKRVASNSSSFTDKASTRTNSGASLAESPAEEPKHHPWKELVDACGGLPPAIVALAEEHQQYSNYNDDWDQIFPKRIWQLIYNSLPHHLKPCLLYLGVLNSCPSTQFKELLIAEGLVQPIISGQQTVAAVEDYNSSAEEYLNELINRNLVEVLSKRWDGSSKEIAILQQWQLMDFCRNKAREENFLEFGDSRTFPLQAKRIAIESWYADYIAIANTPYSAFPLKVRSFLFLEYSPLPRKKYPISWRWDFLIKHYSSSLRVLDLFGVDLNASTIPSEIGKLSHLVYLRVNCVMGIILAKSICNLWNLQFLRVQNNNSSSAEIPLESFWRMGQLKRLLCCHAVLLLPQDYGNSMLHNIERLKHVSVLCCTKDALSRMPNLVSLGVGGPIQQNHIHEICKGLPALKHLQKLGLRGTEYGPLSLRSWNVFLPNITHLTFKRTRLVEDPMRMLGKKLPNLQVLKLEFNAIDGDHLDVCNVTTDDGDGCFRQLKYLKLEELRITRWNLSVGAMPSLEIIVIRNCCALEGLPSKALQEIKSLRGLEIHNYSNEAVEKDAMCVRKGIEKMLQ